MDFEKLRAIDLEAERVNKTYDIFDESMRLNRSKASRVEFITAVHYIDKYITPGSKILDIGAGAGEYSLYYAEKGFDVNALELSDANIAAFEGKIKKDYTLKLTQGNALDLGMFQDQSFDCVLLMGPLYHLENTDDQLKALEEAKRVCKDSGVIITTFISNDMVMLTEFAYDTNHFKSDSYNHETFDVINFPFVFHTVDEAKEVLLESNLAIVHSVAQDGVSELMAKEINALDDTDYEQYLKYHLYCAEKPEMLGRSNHMLFVCKKLVNI